MNVLTAEDAADLIEPLIEGIVEDPLWSTFLDRLRRRTGADYASLVFRPRPPGNQQSGVVHLYSGTPSPPVVSQLYRESLVRSDPLPYNELEDGRVYELPEILKAGDPAHEKYRKELLAPSGMNVMRLMRVVEASGVSAWLTVSRKSGAFTARQDALIAAIGPYLRAALRSLVALEKQRTNASVASAAIQRLNFGWLTLDAEGRVIDSDANGARMLSASGILRSGAGGRLTARSSSVGREIANAVKALVANPQSRPRAIVLSREPWLDMLLVSSNIQPSTARPEPALIAYVHADSWSSADRCEQLAQLFELLPSEARLALALSRGMSIAEAATELGVTVESARTYSKKIYAKTGARGQPDLVRFIHRSVLAIA